MGAQAGAIKGRQAVNVADFGHFEGPLVLCGGPYSNLQATRAMVEAAAGRAVICTGDTVAYCADPAPTVALVRKSGWRVIAGNCERQIAEGADDCGCGFGDGSACDLLSRGWYPHALAATDAAGRAWMAELPDVATFVHEGRRYAVVHGGGTAINRFVWPSSAEVDFERELSAIEQVTGPVDGVISGHCGIAFQRRIGAHHWINAGAIGLPPHDRRPETRYAVLDAGEVAIHRLAYDHEAAAVEMEAVGLTQGYEAALRTGIWPSEDILPPELRM